MDDKRTLLQTLKDLYTKVFIVSLYNRLHQYHSSVDSDQHQQLNVSLHKFINEIIDNVSNYSSEKKRREETSQADEILIKPANANKAVTQPRIASLTLNALSLYFKRNKALEKDPSIASKLQTCVRDHSQSARRLARSGNDISAKIHANIASDALKTLSHYMTSEEYNDFFNEVNQQMDAKKSSPAQNELKE